MNRLTTHEEYPHGAEGKSVDRLTGCWCRGKFEATACVEKLSRYEDTGLEPEEIMGRMTLNGWIPVEERLPDAGREVLAYIKHNYADDGWRAYRVFEYTDHWVGMDNLCEVVAWMPLPEPYHPEVLHEAGKETGQDAAAPVLQPAT